MLLQEILISQDTVPHSISNFEVWDNICYYTDEEDFYSLDITNSQYSFITTFPSANGGEYGEGSSFDGINDILYITSSYGSSMRRRFYYIYRSRCCHRKFYKPRYSSSFNI